MGSEIEKAFLSQVSHLCWAKSDKDENDNLGARFDNIVRGEGGVGERGESL